MASEQDQLRIGSSAAGERLPTLQQCALQRADYEREERSILAGVQHIGGLVDIVMARVRFRTAIRKEAQRGKDSYGRSRPSR
jgi:outer membrane cobalamin receptor